MDFFAVDRDLYKCLASACLPKELIRIPNCSLLYLYSNDMKSLFLKKVIAINITVIKKKNCYTAWQPVPILHSIVTIP